MLKIVHCFTDDKFVKGAINELEFLNDRCENEYVYVHKRFHRRIPFRFIGGISQVRILEEGNFLSFLEDMRCNVVILHNLFSLPIGLISSIPSHIKLVWIAWGFDIYGKMGKMPFIQIPNLYHEETKKLLIPSFMGRFKQYAKNVRNVVQDGNVKKAVNRVDFFSGIIPEEYDMMKDIPFFRAQRVNFSYENPLGGIDFSLLDKEEPIKGLDIMIGNSGEPTNNHADIFLRLKELHIEGRKIIVPLSYAGSMSYKQKVKCLGKRIWGENFVALEDFMPFAEYKTILSSCGFRIFGHERQQAMGNIGMSFREGCKVFLSETSIIYKHYQNSGLKMFTIQNDLNQQNLSVLLNDEETYQNRKIAIERMSSSRQVERLYNFMDTLKNAFM